jgi:hypothetical protein
VVIGAALNLLLGVPGAEMDNVTGTVPDGRGEVSA